MKRTLASLLSLLALSSLFTLSSCQKETTGDGTQFRATMESRDGKTVLNGYALNWVAGDQVAIYGTAGCGLYSATPQTPATVATLDNVGGETGDGPFRAFYPSTLTTDGTTITLPAAQTYVEGSINEFPMYAESATNQLAFRNLCGVLKLHLTKANTNITSIVVTANAPINGNFTISNLNGEPVLFYASNGTNTVVLNCATPQAIDNGKDFYITLPATFDSLKSIELNTDDGRYCIKTVKTNVCINVQRNTVTEIEFGGNDMAFRPIGSKGGLFTINANGDQVWFSQGNLQYQASTETWRFAENQWDCVGGARWGTVYENGVKCDNGLMSPTYDGWIDLFGWGTGDNPTVDESNYSSFVDWGVNAISNGGNVVNTWRTLSSNEWLYIYGRRSEAYAKRGFGKVDGWYGFILLPDDWTMPEDGTFSADMSWSANNYTTAEWLEMEANGAIFIPAAGWAAGNIVGYRWGNAESLCNYWTSTPHNSYPQYAYSLFVPQGSVVMWLFRNYRFAVRLVQDKD